MKRLIATNGETILLDDEHAKHFLSKHEKETSSQMKWTKVKEIRVTVDWVLGLLGQMPAGNKEEQSNHVIEWLNDIGISIDYEDNGDET